MPLRVTVLPTRLQCAFQHQKTQPSSVPAPSSAPWPYRVPLGLPEHIHRPVPLGLQVPLGHPTHLLFQVRCLVTVPLQVTVPQTISAFFQVTVPPARLQCPFKCQYPFWSLYSPLVYPRTYSGTRVQSIIVRAPPLCKFPHGAHRTRHLIPHKQKHRDVRCGEAKNSDIRQSRFNSDHIFQL